ncbi:MAG: tyrosine-type recombinase/integrase [Rhodospirillaceae bacterium]|nr:tyrosine-type recombinase/integrase [Rhodospirillaceae bacterium]
MILPSREHVSPPDLQDQLGDVISDYRAWLEHRGLGPRRTDTLARTARHMVTWLSVSGLETRALDIRAIADFASHDCACPGRFRPLAPHRAKVRANRFFNWLLDTGRVEPPARIVEGGRNVDAFIGELSDQGYGDETMRQYSAACRHFVAWLHHSDLALGQTDDGVIRRFLDHDCACSHPRVYQPRGRFAGSFWTRAMIGRFADFLARTGAIEPWREEVPPEARSDLVDGFLDWMHRHRGVRETTIREYGNKLRRDVLPVLGGDPASYDVSGIRAAFADLAKAGSSARLANIATALRGYLGYLGANGFCSPALVGAVPAIRRQPAANLPRHVGEADIEALIASCDTATPIGMRDHAIMLLLARLALRAGDIAALRLDDLDWEQARIRVDGKSRRRVALPLPQDAGDALKIYILRGRPRAQSDFVFLRSRAPHRGLSCGASVAAVVRGAMGRAGIDGEGLPAAHLFRHSRATNLLRGGASLETVAALLRHKSLETTTLYARVDAPMLLEIAQPWPGDAS